jgi:hypothetical protein
MYSSYSFLTLAIDGGEWSASRPAALYSKETIHRTHWIEAGWTSELVWTQRLEEKSFSSAGDRTPIVQSVIRHYAG